MPNFVPLRVSKINFAYVDRALNSFKRDGRVEEPPESKIPGKHTVLKTMKEMRQQFRYDDNQRYNCCYSKRLGKLPKVLKLSQSDGHRFETTDNTVAVKRVSPAVETQRILNIPLTTLDT
ncbi:hypothetical protein PUN28_000880 [Cardiocondyla obscurior]|uniref:Uncharacterized protein n=1 Tax=Cardiocondyla obscurior TaxID=286306 RepID=A0AAW2H1L9_9HYME